MANKKDTESLVLRGSGGGGKGGGGTVNTPDNLLTQDWFEAVLAVANGPIRGLVKGEHNYSENFFVGDTPAFNPGTGLSNFSDFSLAFYNGREDDPPVSFKLGGSSSNTSVNVRLAQNIAVTRTTPQVQRGTIDRIEVRLLFGQIVHINEKGTHEALAKYRIEYKPSSSSQWLYFQGTSELTKSGKTTSGAIVDFNIPIDRSIDDDWDIRVTKLSPDSDGSGMGDIIDMSWESFQSMQEGEQSYKDLAMVHIFAKASNQFSSVPTFSGIYDGLICRVPSIYDPDTRTYDDSQPWDGSFKFAWTNNPAWILHELCVNEDFGLPAYFVQAGADRFSFMEAARWCDEVVTLPNGKKQPRFTFNLFLTDGQAGLELLQYIAGACSCAIYDRGDGIVVIKSDKPQEPKYLFGPESVTEDGFTYSATDISTRYNMVTAVFVNPNLDWNEDRRLSTIDMSAFKKQNGLVPYEYVAVGCTDPDEAIRRANYFTISSNNEVLSASFVTYRKGLFLELFDTIYIADPVAGWSTGGRIKNIQGDLLNLRDPVYAPSGSVFTLLVETYEGVRSLRVRAVTEGVNYAVRLVTGTFPTASEMPEFAQFTLQDTENFGMAKPFRVVNWEHVDGSLEAVRITAVEVDIHKYADGDAGVITDEAPNQPTRPGMALPSEWVVESGTKHALIGDDGTVTLRMWANWRRPIGTTTDFYEIDFKERGQETWTTVKAVGDDVYLSPVRDEGIYTVRLFAVDRTTGQRIAQYLEKEHVVSGKYTLLPNVENLRMSRADDGYRFYWDGPNFRDYAGVEVRLGAQLQSWEEAEVIAENVLDTKYIYGWFLPGVHYMMFKHKDTSGNYSAVESVIRVDADAIPTPATLRASDDLVFSIKLDWTFSDYIGVIKATEIWVSDTNVLANAQMLAGFSYPTSTHILTGLLAAQEMFFWARFVGMEGIKGPFFPVGPGVRGSSSSDALAILDYIKGQILESHLGQELLSRIPDIERIADIERLPEMLLTLGGLALDINDLTEELDGMRAEIAAIAGTPPYDPETGYPKDSVVAHEGRLYRAKVFVPVGESPPNLAYWEDVGEYVSIGDAITALVVRINEIEDSSVRQIDLLMAGRRWDDDEWGRVADAVNMYEGRAMHRVERTVRVAGDKALSQTIETWMAETNQAIAAAIVEANRAMTDATRALAERITNFEARFNDANAQIQTDLRVLSDADQSLAESILQMQVTIDEDITAKLLEEARLRVTEDEALAESIRQAQVQFGEDIAAAVREESRLRATEDEALAEMIRTTEVRFAEDIASAVLEESTQRATAVEAVNTRLTQAQTEYRGNNTALLEKTTQLASADVALSEQIEQPQVRFGEDISAAILDERALRVTAVSAVNDRVTQSQVEYRGNYSALTDTTNQLANADAAMTTRVNGVQATANNASSAVQQQTTALANLQGDMNATYSVKAQVTRDGRVYAAGFAVGVTSAQNSSKPLSQFLIQADQFAIIHTTDGASNATTVPFAVQGGQTILSTLVADRIRVKTLMIEDRAVTVPVYQDRRSYEWHVDTSSISVLDHYITKEDYPAQTQHAFLVSVSLSCVSTATGQPAQVLIGVKIGDAWLTEISSMGMSLGGGSTASASCIELIDNSQLSSGSNVIRIRMTPSAAMHLSAVRVDLLRFSAKK